MSENGAARDRPEIPPVDPRRLADELAREVGDHAGRLVAKILTDIIDPEYTPREQRGYIAGATILHFDGITHRFEERILEHIEEMAAEALAGPPPTDAELEELGREAVAKAGAYDAARIRDSLVPELRAAGLDDQADALEQFARDMAARAEELDSRGAGST